MSLLSEILSALKSSDICTNTKIEEIKEFSDTQYFLKIRTSVTSILKLQIRIYQNGIHIDYSYQLFSDKSVVRWDNVEHFPDIETYPHHFNNKDGKVTSSPLTGNPSKDVYLVLDLIKEILYDVESY